MVEAVLQEKSRGKDKNGTPGRPIVFCSAFWR
jgi:hypothetical protein